MAIWTFDIHGTHTVNRPIGRERSAGYWKVLRNRNRCRWKRRNKEHRKILGM